MEIPAGIVILLALGYLALLFGIAYWGDRQEEKGRSLIRNPYVYALSLAVYCTAWTFYGSVGRAATSGMQFICIYLGPTLMAPLWIYILRKIITIAQSQRINSIADFISARYGKSTFLGGLVSVIAIFGIIPYISLQLKAIYFSFDLLTQTDPIFAPLDNHLPFYQDTAFIIALVLAIFTIFFGTRHLEASERHEGLVAAIAFESLVKLIAFLAVGFFVVFGLYDGVGDLFQKANKIPEIIETLNMSGPTTSSPGNWFWLILVSMLASLLLPRQFHVAVVENTDVKHLYKAMWLFPLYLLLINLFVVPIAVGGMIEFPNSVSYADAYVLRLPLAHYRPGLALLVFIGGLSASTSMVIVATIALSIMASNNLIVPLLLQTSVVKEGFESDLTWRLRAIRRLVIILILLLAYVYYSSLGQRNALVSIGLVSFVAVAQFGPALIGGIFWREGTKAGAIAGLLAGFILWGLTLPIPSLVAAGYLPTEILQDGVLGLGILRPTALFGLEGMDEISHAAFWSLTLNTSLYIGVSLFTQQSAIEYAQANTFVNIFRKSPSAQEKGGWHGRAFLSDIQLLLNRFLGKDRAEELLMAYARRNQINLDQVTEVGAEMVNYTEKLLAGAIGSASSSLLVSSIFKEEPLTRQDMMEVLDETQQIIRYSRELERKSRELERASQKLKAANERLREMDKLKDDFITTVTHELRTPITSIRSISHILNDNQELPEKQRAQFLGIIVAETDRISRLINQVLDLEKMESGHAEWHIREVDIQEVLAASVDGIRQLCVDRNISLDTHYSASNPVILGDRDRLNQVFVNLLSNAMKFCDEDQGKISVSLREDGEELVVLVTDNGAGIKPSAQAYIFDKFTQFHGYKKKGQQGSGLGLSISWRIINYHKGNIQVESDVGKGATFRVSLPLRVPMSSFSQEEG